MCVHTGKLWGLDLGVTNLQYNSNGQTIFTSKNDTGKLRVHRFGARDGGLLSLVVGSVCAGGRVFLHRLVSGTDSTISGLGFGDLRSPDIGVSRNSLTVHISFSGSTHAVAVSSGNVNVATRRLRHGLNAVTRSNSRRFGARGTRRRNSRISVVNRFNINFCSTFVITDRIGIIDHTCNRSITRI